MTIYFWRSALVTSVYWLLLVMGESDAEWLFMVMVWFYMAYDLSNWLGKVICNVR